MAALNKAADGDVAAGVHRKARPDCTVNHHIPLDVNAAGGKVHISFDDNDVVHMELAVPEGDLSVHLGDQGGALLV